MSIIRNRKKDPRNDYEAEYFADYINTNVATMKRIKIKNT